MFHKTLDHGKVQCQTCFRKCVVSPGSRGFCRVRENRDGKYYSLVYAQPSAIQIDPVEKELQYHFLPGTEILCFGTVGCNFRCRHCHNWHLSQSSPGNCRTYNVPPEKAVEMVMKRGATFLPCSHIPVLVLTAQAQRVGGHFPGKLLHIRGALLRLLFPVDHAC